MTNKSNTNTWIIGCGNIGQRVNQLLKQQNIKLKATSHSDSSAKLLKEMGIEVFSANLDEPDSLNKLPIDEHADIFYFAPPAAKGETDERMSHFLASLNPEAPPRRIIYISTTGVYGNHDGEWITENTPTEPQHDRSKRRLHAEEQIKQFCLKHGSEYMILRTSGIYDLKKLPLERINSGLKVLKKETAPSSNRIHAADLANICVTAMQSPHHNDIFNVSDGNPSSISDYFIQTARLFNLKTPEEITREEAKAVLSPEMLSYLSESKKIDSSYLQKKLGITLAFPTLEEGLIDCKKEYDKQRT